MGALAFERGRRREATLRGSVDMKQRLPVCVPMAMWILPSRSFSLLTPQQSVVSSTAQQLRMQPPKKKETPFERTRKNPHRAGLHHLRGRRQHYPRKLRHPVLPVRRIRQAPNHRPALTLARTPSIFHRGAAHARTNIPCTLDDPFRHRSHARPAPPPVVGSGPKLPLRGSILRFVPYLRASNSLLQPRPDSSSSASSARQKTRRSSSTACYRQ